MDISAAALPPIQPHISAADRAHPLFPEYNRLRAGFSAKLITAPAFSDWLYQREQHAIADQWAAHERFPEFQRWMQDTKAGGRRCCPTSDMPRGLCFPANFEFWLGGGRW